jgi:cytochrome c peroxidase
MRSRLVLGLALWAGSGLAQETPAPSFRYLQQPPKGMPPMPLPGTPATEAVFELGQRLFSDPVLSSDRTVSCASCHRQELAFASPESRPSGVQGKTALRHAPTLLNRGWGRTQRWDGSTPTLEAFVLEPISDPNEMALPLETALQRLGADAAYQKEFAAAFQDGVTAENLRTALATFVRGIVAPEAPVHRFHAGDVAGMTTTLKAGLWVFMSKGGCWKCHPMPNFTDDAFHNTGVGVRDGKPEPGREAHTRTAQDLGRFKTPTLRGVRLSAPYMHDASLATLGDVVSFYDRGGNANPNLDRRMQPLGLTEQDKQNLIAFLTSL